MSINMKELAINAIAGIVSSAPEQAAPVAPSLRLENIHVNVMKLPKRTEGDLASELKERFEDLCLEYAARREMADQEPLALNDEIVADVAAYANGSFLPFSARGDLELVLEPDSIAPGVGSALVGTAVGESVVVQSTIPDGYPEKRLRGCPASYAISIKEARRLTLPDPEDPSFFEAVGRGKTLEDVFASLTNELVEEENELEVAGAYESLIDALVSSAGMEIPEEEITKEIRRRWLEDEGRFLEERGFDIRTRDLSLHGWLSSEPLRSSVCRDIAITAILQRAAREYSFEVTEEEIADYLEGVAGSSSRRAEDPIPEESDMESVQDLIKQYVFFRYLESVADCVVFHREP